MTDETEQMDLLNTAENDGCEGAPSRVFPAARVENRGPGRPKGARNKKSEAIEKLYQAKGYRDPLLFQGEIMSSHPLDMRKWFIAMEGQSRGLTYEQAMEKWKADLLPGIPSIAEIVAMQSKVADQVTPYLYGKKPLQKEDEGDALPLLFIDLGEDGQGGANPDDEGSLSIGLPLEDQSQQYQSLSDKDISTSHGSMSHEEAKALKDKGE